MPAAVFEIDGDRALPTALARGPWSPDAQHGGAAAALIARAAERCDPGPADFVARLTIDLLRPVPLAPLEVRARTTRPGKKVQWVEVVLVADDVEIVRATALHPHRGPRSAGARDCATRLPPPRGQHPVRDRLRVGRAPCRLHWSPPRCSGSCGDGRRSRRRAGAARLLERDGSAPGPRLVDRVGPGNRVVPAPCRGGGRGGADAAATRRGRRRLRQRRQRRARTGSIPLHQPGSHDRAAPSTGRRMGRPRCRHARRGPRRRLAESALYDERGRIGRSVQTLIVDRL